MLSSSYVSDVEAIDLTGASPDFTREQFLAHSQARVNAALNTYAALQLERVRLGVTIKCLLVGWHQNGCILQSTQIVNLKHAVSTAATPAAGNTTVSDKFMVYSYQGKTPSLSVYDNKTQVNASTSNPAYTVKFDATQNTMTD